MSTCTVTVSSTVKAKMLPDCTIKDGISPDCTIKDEMSPDWTLKDEMLTIGLDIDLTGEIIVNISHL